MLGVPIASTPITIKPNSWKNFPNCTKTSKLELASRAHQKNIIPVVNQALSKANIAKNKIDAIAYTRGPGLLGSLLVGLINLYIFKDIDQNHPQINIIYGNIYLFSLIIPNIPHIQSPT